MLDPSSTPTAMISVPEICDRHCDVPKNRNPSRAQFREPPPNLFRGEGEGVGSGYEEEPKQWPVASQQPAMRARTTLLSLPKLPAAFERSDSPIPFLLVLRDTSLQGTAGSSAKTPKEQAPAEME